MSAWRARIQARAGDFTLDVEVEGEAGAVALIGPNGAGKTTLLRALLGAIPVEEAEIAIADNRLVDTRRGVDAPMERRRIGYLPQGYGLFPHLSVEDNVAFGLSTGPERLPRSERRERARALLETLGVGGLARRRVRGLSGGERQRVALARALIIEPELLLLDEPLAALDATTRRAVREALAERLHAFGRPCVVVTHDARDVEALGAEVIALEGGRVVQRGSLEALRAAPASDFIAEFVGV